eukprot:scaffold225216_cov36-Prasinocladus_malaysianus.AAC.2
MMPKIIFTSVVLNCGTAAEAAATLLRNELVIFRSANGLHSLSPPPPTYQIRGDEAYMLCDKCCAMTSQNCHDIDSAMLPSPLAAKDNRTDQSPHAVTLH